MLARGSGKDRRPDPSRWYLQKELAELWRVHPVTVRKWLMLMRRNNCGPAKDQTTVRKINAARRYVLIRGDFARFMETVWVTEKWPAYLPPPPPPGPMK